MEEAVCDTKEESPYNMPIPYDSPLHDVFTSGRTRAEYLYDLDFLYNTLLENFPYFGTILRSHGADLHTRFLETREHIMTRSDFPSDGHFAATLSNSFVGHSRGVGHLDVVPTEGILLHIHVFNQAIEQHGATQLQPFLDELNNPATRALHNLTDADFILSLEGMESIVYPTTSDNIQTHIIEEDRIAYVNILDMEYLTMELDRVTLTDFFYSVADYEHLIIDIRQNMGGDGRFFPDLVMSPNISYVLQYEYYVFLMGGEQNRRILSALFDTEDLVRPINDDVIARLPYFRDDYVHMFSYYLRSGYYIEPSHGTGIFGGKIWLLVSSRNGSASEFALAAAKQTGFATLVGEQTGGGGHSLQFVMVALPNSGTVVRFSAGYGVDYMGRESYEHGTQPHYFNRQGMDALETVLAMIEEVNY